MAKYMMVVQSEAKDGRDDEYNHWYDGQHLADVLAIPGVTGGRRFDAMPGSVGARGMRYLAIYEIDSEDPHAVLAELEKRAADGTMAVSDALDPESVRLWLYKARA